MLPLIAMAQVYADPVASRALTSVQIWSRDMQERVKQFQPGTRMGMVSQKEGVLNPARAEAGRGLGVQTIAFWVA